MTGDQAIWERKPLFDPDEVLGLVITPIPLLVKLKLLFTRKYYACEQGVWITYKDLGNVRFILKVWQTKKERIGL